MKINQNVLSRVLPLTLLLGANMVTAQGVGTYKVGVITSLSGDLAEGGSVTKRGYELWGQTTNAAGGVLVKGKRYKVELKFADDQSNPASAADAAERLISSEKVHFILGPYASGVTLAVAPITEKYSVPMITGSAESPKIWQQGFKYTFGTIPPVNFTGAAAMATIAKLSPAPKTVAILATNDAFSSATAEAFRGAAQKSGMRVLSYNVVPSGTDFTPLVSALKARNPDVVAFGGHDEELSNLVKAMRSLNFSPKALLMHYGVTAPDFVNALGKDANSVFGASVWTEDLAIKVNGLFKTPAAYAQASMARYKVAADYTQAGCTAAGLAFEAALQRGGLTPNDLDSPAGRAKLRDALEKIDLNTFYGRIKFDTDPKSPTYHANVGLAPLTVQIQNGKVSVVSSGNAKAIYPARPYGQR